MARLINVDVLVGCVTELYEYDLCHVDTDYYIEGRISAEHDILEKIRKQPTVNAIPVEWLENRLNALCFEAMGAGALYGDRIGELAKSINEVMKLWQKEQEAR